MRENYGLACMSTINMGLALGQVPINEIQAILAVVASVVTIAYTIYKFVKGFKK